MHFFWLSSQPKTHQTPHTTPKHTNSTDIDDLLSPVVTCPHGCVEAIMKGSVAAGEVVQSATPGETLQAIIPRLSKVWRCCCCC
jgi:hypothetical protein